MLAALGLVLGVVTEVEQRVMALGRFHNNVATAATIAARGTASRNKLFAAEGHAAITTVTGFYADFRFINKHCFHSV